MKYDLFFALIFDFYHFAVCRKYGFIWTNSSCFVWYNHLTPVAEILVILTVNLLESIGFSLDLLLPLFFFSINQRNFCTILHRGIWYFQLHDFTLLIILYAFVFLLDIVPIAFKTRSSNLIKNWDAIRLNTFVFVIVSIRKSCAIKFLYAKVNRFLEANIKFRITVVSVIDFYLLTKLLITIWFIIFKMINQALFLVCDESILLEEKAVGLSLGNTCFK